MRINPKGVSEKTVDADVASGELTGSALENFRALVSDLYLPIIQEQQGWGKVRQPGALCLCLGLSPHISVPFEGL